METEQPQQIRQDQPQKKTADRQKYMREYMKKYYQKHRAKVLEAAKQKIACPCGAFVCKTALSKHRKSQKHAFWILKKKVEELKNL